MTDPVLLERPAFVVPEGWDRRASGEFARWYMTRWYILVPVLLLVVVVAAALVPLLFDASLVPVVVIIASAAGLAGAAIVTYVGTRRSLRLSYPAGFAATAAVEEHELRSVTAIGTGTIALRGLRSVHVTRNTILIVMRASLAIGIMPRDVLSEGELLMMRTRVATLRRS